MKKLFAVLAGLMTYSAAYALPVYNPAQPELLQDGFFTPGYEVFFCEADCWALELGYRGDFVSDRKMRHRNLGHLLSFHKPVSKVQSTTNAGQITLNLWNRIEVYGWFGANQIDFETQVNYLSLVAHTPATGLINLFGRSTEGYAWGVGVRGVLWHCGYTVIGIDAQYSHRRHTLQSLTLDGRPIQVGDFVSVENELPLDPGDFHSRNRDWQVSLGIAHRVCRLVPYAAVVYSAARHHFAGPQFRAFPIVAGQGVYDPDLKLVNRNCVGIAVGATFVTAEQMQVTVEGRFIDERALTITSDIRF